MTPALPCESEATVDLFPHFARLDRMARQAWTMAVHDCPAYADSTTRKNTAHNAYCQVLLPAEKVAAGLLLGKLPKGRYVPILNASGARYDYGIRFNCLNASYHAGGIHTGQRGMFESQAGSRQLSLLKPFVHLRSGYVLDSLGIDVETTVLVLTVSDIVQWAIDLPTAIVGAGLGGVAPIPPATPIVPMSGVGFTSSKKKPAAEDGPAAVDGSDKP